MQVSQDWPLAKEKAIPPVCFQSLPRGDHQAYKLINNCNQNE